MPPVATIDEKQIEPIIERVMVRILSDPKRFHNFQESVFLTQVIEHGGSFEWLKDEPDLYTDEDIKEKV